MKVLAIDVGIQTLSYCKLDKKNDNDFEILDWGIINLHDERKLCMFEKRNKKLCNGSAHFYLNLDNIPLYLCNTHKQKYKLPEIKIETKTSPKNSKCCYLNKSEEECGKLAKNEIENKHYCTPHTKSHVAKINKENSFKPIADQNANYLPIQYLAIKLCAQLESKKSLLDVDEVVIENQPSKKNPTMKTISTFVYGYYCLKGIVEKQATNSPIVNVKFVNPSNKLKIDSNAKRIIELQKKKVKSKAYKLTKQFGEEYCKAIIKEHPDKLLLLNTFAKKDDMCDAFLHAFSYSFQNGLPEKYKNSIAEINKNLEEQVNSPTKKESTKKESTKKESTKKESTKKGLE